MTAGHDPGAGVTPCVVESVSDADSGDMPNQAVSDSPGRAPVAGGKRGHFWRNAVLITLGVVVILGVLALLVGLADLALTALTKSAENRHGDYVGTWVGTTEDGTAIRLAVRNETGTYTGSFVIFDPTNPASPQVKAYESDPEELTYVEVHRDPTGILKHGFWLEDKLEDTGPHLSLGYREGSALKTIALTRVE